MGIYISGVKGLPEQVQKNKEDIKTIQEEIEGIDFEQIRELEEQVGENTQDINNLEASIGVQNQAINTLNNDVDALESKTQLMSYNDDLSKTEFRNDIEVADGVYATSLNVVGDGTIVNANMSGLHFQEGANDDDVVLSNKESGTAYNLTLHADGSVDIDGDLKASNVEVDGNGTFQNANGSGLHFQEGANDDEVVLSNRESGTAHYLTLHADGTLTLDGQAVGGGKTLYAHYIRLESKITFTIISDRSTAYTRAALMTYLQTTIGGSYISVNGYTEENGNKYIVLNLYYASTNQVTLGAFDYTNGYQLLTMNISSSGVYDYVVTI